MVRITYKYLALPNNVLMTLIFERMNTEIRQRMIDNIPEMLSDASKHYRRNSHPPAAEDITAWFNEFYNLKHNIDEHDLYVVWLELSLLSTMHNTARAEWVGSHVIVNMINEAENRVYECEKAAFPECPTYLETPDERAYERLVCGAIENYLCCINGKELVNWLKAFKESLYAHRATPEHCKALSLMYCCGTFVCVEQATNLARRGDDPSCKLV